MQFRQFPTNTIIKSKFQEKEKSILTKYGFPVSGHRAVIFDYYEPYLTTFPELQFENLQFIGIAFDKGAKIHLTIQVNDGCVFFVDSEHSTIDLLNTSYDHFIRSIIFCDTFFYKNPEFLNDVVESTKENKDKIDNFKKHLMNIDDKIWDNENNGWNVFIEELYYLLD